MNKTKKDITKIKKVGVNYVYDSHFISEMDEEGYKKIINILQNQIKTTKKIIEANNPDKKIKIEVEKLKNNLKAQKEALKNYDKMFDKEIKKQLANKEKNKKILKETIDNHLKIKEITIAQTRLRVETYLANFKFQLKKDKQMLKLYKDLGEINEIKNK